MFFDTVNKVTDIILFNSRNIGALIVDEKPHVKSWDEPQYSIMNLGIEESYGFGVLNEGQAIAVAKNVKEHQSERSTPAGVRSSRSIRQRLLPRIPAGLVAVDPFEVGNDSFDLVTLGFIS
jgi:hypothetical protein